MIREMAYGLLCVAVSAYALEWSLSLFDDPNEPPRFQSKVPLIGHLLGLLRTGPTYYTTTSKQIQAEMYTIPILNTKIYISNTPRLTPLIQKASKSLSFRPLLQTVSRFMGDANDETFALFGGDLATDFSNAIVLSLAPGPHLDTTNANMGGRVLVEIDSLLGSTSGGRKNISLLQWTRRAVVQASSCGVFGQAHPFLDPKVEEAFWIWQPYLPSHMAGIDLTGKGYAAREVVYDALRKYYKSLPEDASQVVRERQRVLLEAGVCQDDAFKLEGSFCVGMFGNTVPTTYWTLYEIFSRPEVLEELRDQVSREAVRGSREEGFVLDVAALKTKCPLLGSVFQETQRVRHVHAITRKVMSDTLLDDRYLLKSGNYLQMPGGSMHTNSRVWGATAEAFDPYRFMPREGVERRVADEHSSFVAWGAAPHLCPARQFASTEILIMVALFAMRVDMRPVGGGGWETSPALDYRSLVTVPNPKTGVEVEVRGRDEWRGDWSLDMGQSTTRVSLASG